MNSVQGSKRTIIIVVIRCIFYIFLLGSISSWFSFSLFIVCYHSVAVLTKSSFEFYFYFEVLFEIKKKILVYGVLCNIQTYTGWSLVTCKTCISIHSYPQRKFLVLSGILNWDQLKSNFNDEITSSALDENPLP